MEGGARVVRGARWVAAALGLWLGGMSVGQGVVDRSLEGQPAGIRAQIAAARDAVFPALVNVHVVTVSYWGGKESKGTSVGSGTIVGADGLVVTNQHVVDGGKSFRVTLSDKREVRATLVGEDPLTDLAVLRLDMGEVGSAGLPAVARFGESGSLRIGDYVLAMGSPFALSRSVTLGIVSNTERVFTGASGDDLANQEFDFESSSDIFTRWIQHDALINPGNSGGPLVSLGGEVVGVNTRGGAGMSFAIPAALARDVAARLVRDGEVIRSSIGVSLKSVKRSGHERGILVNSVDDAGPAAKAGIRAGDVLLRMDGEEISAKFPEEIPVVAREIADKPVGTAVAFVLARGGEELSVTVTTEKMQREKPAEAALRVFGMSVRQITERAARAWRLPSTKGAMVYGVRGGGPAGTAEPAMQSGDVVRRIGSKQIASVDDAVEAYRAIASQDPRPEFVLVEFDRAGKSQVTLVRPRPDKPEDPPRELAKAWIGVATQPVLRDLARELGIEGKLGFRVTRVYPGTKAGESQLRVGDVVTSLNGEPLAPRGMQDAGMFQRQVRRLRAGERATLGVVREGQELEVSLELERTKIEPGEALQDSNKDFEMSVRELTFFDRDENRWDEGVQGVLVTSVEDAGWASFAGLYPGDLVQSINDEAVSDIPGYRRVMERIAKDQPARVTFLVLRGHRTQFKFAEPEWKPKTSKETKDE